MGFRYPDAGVRTDLTAAFAELRTAQAGRVRLASWKTVFGTAEEAWNTADAAWLESEYVRLFLAGGPCPLRETAYGDGRRIAGRAYELADISGFYRAFGCRLSRDRAQVADHLSAELEFASVMLVKEAYAIAEGWEEQREITRNAVKDFFEYHLGRWVRALADALAEHDPPAVYTALVDLTCAAVAGQCRRFRITPELAEGRLPRDFMQAEVFDCPQVAAESHGRPGN
jgi:TorA maturation chaperone TorD